MSELKGSHEETETRLLLHAKHAADAGVEAIVVTADDTNVMILFLCFSDNIACPIFQKCGTKKWTNSHDLLLHSE